MYDNEGYYVVLPDPDTEPEDYFKGLTWEQIKGELDRLQELADYKYWFNQMQDEAWYRENGWWKDNG